MPRWCRDTFGFPWTTPPRSSGRCTGIRCARWPRVVRFRRVAASVVRRSTAPRSTFRRRRPRLVGGGGRRTRPTTTCSITKRSGPGASRESPRFRCKIKPSPKAWGRPWIARPSISVPPTPRLFERVAGCLMLLDNCRTAAWCQPAWMTPRCSACAPPPGCFQTMSHGWTAHASGSKRSPAGQSFRRKRRASMSELAGRVVAITGAARGMGRAYTRAFLDEGARVVAMDVSWEPTGFSGDLDESFRRELEDRRDDALLVTTDVTNDAHLDAAFEATMRKWGTVDVLINNAAMRQRNLFPPTGRVTTLETSDSDWQRMFAVNVFGALKVTRRFIRPMLENQRGSVISTISSGALHHSHCGAYMALRPNSREMPYQSTKSALLTMMFYLADEVKEHNVAVNIMVPGHTRTTGFDEQNLARREMGLASRN